MSSFQMTCGCGDVVTVEAEDRVGAVAQIKGMFNQPAIDAHMAEKHPGDPSMSEADCHAMIEQHVAPVGATVE